MDLKNIICCITQGDQDNVLTQLDHYNTEFTNCYFYNVEEQERRKFRTNKVKEYVPDSDWDSGDADGEDSDIVLRRLLAEALLRFIRTDVQPGVVSVCLRTLRILSRDHRALAPFITDSAILTLAFLGGIKVPPLPYHSDEEGEDEEEIKVKKAEHVASDHTQVSSAAPYVSSAPLHTLHHLSEDVTERAGSDSIHNVLARGKRDIREEEEDERSDDTEVGRKEAIKTLCNVIYNSQRAQERASVLRLLPGLSDKLKVGIRSVSPPSGQFYELRLLFLLTALRPELRRQLQQEGGVSMLMTALEQCLGFQRLDVYEVMSRDTPSPPICKEASQRAIKILKVLFNITFSSHTQQPDEDDAALYRRLAAILRHCLLLHCQGEELTEELQGQAVNVMSALPLQCLDILLSAHLSTGSRESAGVNMDCVHSLLLFIERRLDRGQKLKERLTPVLNLLTEICSAHRETRHYLRQQILPPLRDVVKGDALRNKLVRLMTHVDTELKHCAAELLFVLCKENVGRFIKYTGYGNAAGLLAARGLLSGRSSASRCEYSSDSDSDTEEYRRVRDRINPVTGRVEEPQPDPMEGMSEAEKEAEAVRLVAMFTRLSRNQIIQPVSVMLDGRLAPLSGRMRNSTLDEEEENEEVEADCEEEVD